MSQGLVTASYIVAAVLFIASLAGLSKQETAKYGNWFGITGMAIALIATIASPSVHGVIFILVAMVIGGAIGARLALKVEMTQVPAKRQCNQGHHDDSEGRATHVDEIQHQHERHDSR